MKVKKQKRHRRAVRFYTACFGFREPFKVLCDSTFVHHLLVNKILPADTAIANILGAQVKLFTTRCALKELKSLGKELKSLHKSCSDSHDAASNLLTARCDHEQRVRADNCLMDVIGEKNDEHFFVATQDDELRRKFQEIPGVPLIYGLRNSLFMEKPSTLQHQFAKAFEDARSHMTEQEYKLLKMKKETTTEGASISSDGNASSGDVRIKPKAQRGLEVKDTVKFKKRKAKGPNPLSCLPKKTSGKKDAASEKGSSSADKTSGTRRKKKRSRKKKSVATPTS